MVRLLVTLLRRQVIILKLKICEREFRAKPAKVSKVSCYVSCKEKTNWQVCDKYNSIAELTRSKCTGVMIIERRKFMDLINFILSLTVGAVIGWFAHQMVAAQHELQADKSTSSEDVSSAKS
jgi:hypothetical protein